MRIETVIIFVLITSVPDTECARILGVFHYNGKSHFMVFEALMKGLAAKGHQVVVLSHFPQKNPIPNYTDIDVSGKLASVLDNITIDTALSWKTNIPGRAGCDLTFKACQVVMNHPRAQDLVKSTEKFDLVVTEIYGSECVNGFAWKFNATLAHVISSVSFPWTHGRIGNPDHPAYVPNYFLPYTSKMDFWQRLTNTVYNVLLNIGNRYYCSNPTTVLMKEFFGKDVPSAEELAKTASLVLVNSYFSISWPRPAVPGFVEVGGINVQKPKELPQDFKKFFDESAHGVVYFNMGTLIQVQTLPPEKLKALLDTFAGLPERVLMKYTGSSLPGKPHNVMISKWIPQIDVLSHPKTKVFVSHGGLGSIHETVYAGVPVVGIPIFGDQESNINSLLQLGMATKLNYHDITKDSLLKAIRTVIDNSSYKENAKKVSAHYRDRPMTALETAVYWVEYVIRHRGAPHLRSAAADMPLYQYLLLDVIGFLLLAATISVCIVCYVIKTVLRVLVGRKSAEPLTKSKKE